MVRVRALLWAVCVGAAVVSVSGVRAHAAGDFVNFESGHVHPLALSPDATRLYAVNTPDNRLEIFTIGANGVVTSAGEVVVGLEPVTVVARTNTEVWVVNHLSDSVSVVDAADPAQARVVATLLVGDEPQDIVFAGSSGTRAFVSTAHRGQNRPGDPQLTTPGVGRADVWVFDVNNLAAAPSIVTLFGDSPRALAASPDGSRVYAAVLHAGNRTTAITEQVVTGSLGLPPPAANTNGNPAPKTGLIVKDNGTGWFDELNRDWSFAVPFTLPDKDVFVLDANATPPAELPGEVVSGVGATLFNMAVNPVTGQLYVSNTDARNEVRFEPNVRGHIAESRVTIISGGSTVAKHLNPHIRYGVSPGPPSEINKSLAFPTDIAVSSDGTRLYVAAFGSGKVGELDANGNVRRRIVVGGGPSGLALDETHKRLYVLNRFENTISVVSTLRRRELSRIPLRFDPSPAAVKKGRPFLYNALKSGHGDSACASCHVFADFDSLAWDLGDPNGAVVPNTNPFVLSLNPNPVFHPMKGPMTTQSLRGMANAGPMHWRGDRSGADVGQALNTDLAFKKFTPAFVGLLGSGTPLSAPDMQAFTDFILTVVYPPNPNANLDGTLTAEQQAGKDFFLNTPVDGGLLKCAFCHALPLGTAGLMSFEGETQEFKVAHLRNLYQKVGMFAAAGDQVRGFGFLHDGSIATAFDFLHAAVFAFGSDPDTKRRNVEAFMMAFDTGLAPAVGQQANANPSNFTDPTVTDRIDLLVGRAAVVDCDLIVKGVVGGLQRGWLYDPGLGQFRSDRAAEAGLSAGSLLALAGVSGQSLNYSCVPPGMGTRVGIDRDRDGVLDGDELDAGSDPADPGDPGSCQGFTTTHATFRGLMLAADDQLTLTADFFGGPPRAATDDVRVTLSTNVGPLINAQIRAGFPGFRPSAEGSTYRDVSAINQGITYASVRLVSGMASRMTLRMAKTSLTNAVGATSLNAALRISRPGSATACYRTVGVVCTVGSGGTMLACNS